MDIHYAFFPEDNLLIQKFSGLFSCKEYGSHIATIMQDSRTQWVKKVLLDFRNADFISQEKTFVHNLKRMIAKRKEMNASFPGDDSIIRVFWVDKPLPTAVVHIFTESFPESQYNYCSSVEAILELLQLPSSYAKLENIVDGIV